MYTVTLGKVAADVAGIVAPHSLAWLTNKSRQYATQRGVTRSVTCLGWEFHVSFSHVSFLF
jgi:hypothetical protein